MNSEPPGILRYYQPEKATTSESDESKAAEKCNNKEQLQNSDEEMTQQDVTEAAAKSEAVSKHVQVISQKKESKRRRFSDKITDLNERKKINITESNFVEDESSKEEHDSHKIAEIRILYPTQLLQIHCHHKVLDKELVTPKFFIPRVRPFLQQRRAKT